MHHYCREHSPLAFKTEELLSGKFGERELAALKRSVPQGISAGVLSEDLVYDQIEAARDAAFRMLELAADILKNRI